MSMLCRSVIVVTATAAALAASTPQAWAQG
jgi:hypothetical protein